MEWRYSTISDERRSYNLDNVRKYQEYIINKEEIPYSEENYEDEWLHLHEGSEEKSIEINYRGESFRFVCGMNRMREFSYSLNEYLIDGEIKDINSGDLKNNICIVLKSREIGNFLRMNNESEFICKTYINIKTRRLIIRREDELKFLTYEFLEYGNTYDSPDIVQSNCESIVLIGTLKLRFNKAKYYIVEKYEINKREFIFNGKIIDLKEENIMYLPIQPAEIKIDGIPYKTYEVDKSILEMLPQIDYLEELYYPIQVKMNETMYVFQLAKCEKDGYTYFYRQLVVVKGGGIEIVEYLDQKANYCRWNDIQIRYEVEIITIPSMKEILIKINEINTEFQIPYFEGILTYKLYYDIVNRKIILEKI